MTETDILIIGSGPAGCTAAIYGARSGFKTLVLTGKSHGGQLVKTNDVENFPGFQNPLSGYEVMDHIHKQCARLGINFEIDTVVKVEGDKTPFTVHLESGKTIKARVVIVATGSTASWLGIESEQAFIGKGVSTCATCDGFFYKNKEACVIGGGNKAFEEAMFLTKFCSKVYLIHRRDGFRAHKATIDKLQANPKVEFVLSSTVETVNGDEHGVSSVTVKNVHSGALRDIAVKGVFVSIGTIPQTDFLKGTAVHLAKNGHVVVNNHNHTNVEGIFAAGDCADDLYNQAIIAAGSGAKAAMAAITYLNEQ